MPFMTSWHTGDDPFPALLTRNTITEMDIRAEQLLHDRADASTWRDHLTHADIQHV
jgi:hypothetical protein